VLQFSHDLQFPPGGLSGGTASGDPEWTGQTARLAVAFVDSALADLQQVLDCQRQLASTTFADAAH
jgi:hypothetical protein